MNIFFILALVSINVFVFWRTLSYGYAIDDYGCLKKPTVYKSWISKIWGHFYGVFYQSSRIAHGINLFIHTANTVLIYLVFGHNEVSFLAAVLFCINPSNTQGSVWISGKFYAANTMLALLMQAWYVTAPVFYYLCFFLTVNAVPAPLVYLATDKWWMIAALTPIAVIMVNFIKSQSAAKMQYAMPDQKRFKVRNLVLMAKTIGYYFMMCLVPRRLGVYHTYLYTYGLSEQENKQALKIDRYFWIGLIVAYIAITNIRIGNIQSFGLWWWFVFIIPWSNWITIHQSIAERYSYLPSVGLMLMLSAMIYTIALPYRLFVIGAVLAYYLTRLLCHIESYVTYEWQIWHNMINSPDSHAMWCWKGIWEKGNNMPYTAMESFSRALRCRKDDFRATANLTDICIELGLLTYAREYIKHVKSWVPTTPAYGNEVQDWIADREYMITCKEKGAKPDERRLRMGKKEVQRVHQQ